MLKESHLVYQAFHVLLDEREAETMGHELLKFEESLDSLELEEFLPKELEEEQWCVISSIRIKHMIGMILMNLYHIMRSPS